MATIAIVLVVCFKVVVVVRRMKSKNIERAGLFVLDEMQENIFEYIDF